MFCTLATIMLNITNRTELNRYIYIHTTYIRDLSEKLSWHPFLPLSRLPYYLSLFFLFTELTSHLRSLAVSIHFIATVSMIQCAGDKCSELTNFSNVRVLVLAYSMDTAVAKPRNYTTIERYYWYKMARVKLVDY